MYKSVELFKIHIVLAVQQTEISFISDPYPGEKSNPDPFDRPGKRSNPQPVFFGGGGSMLQYRTPESGISNARIYLNAHTFT